MRGRLVLVLVAVGFAAAVIVADASAASFMDLSHGSVELEPRSEGLPAGRPCPEPSDESEEPCPRRYAFRLGQSLVAWISVRNNGPLPVTLRGVSRDWLGQYEDFAPLAAPVAGLDGGDGFRSIGVEFSGAPFELVVLDPGDERLVGVEFRTTDDRADACERWVEGSAVQWASVTIAWHWLYFGHETELAFVEPIDFMAPTERDCA